ncbi:MAG: hypothetical protein CMO38_04015 [Verrucomicrobiaceae bacterium]|nr:hypothetical protein [Verrucomicrobiaceae bacterium]
MTESINSVAERILFAENLEEKLKLGPRRAEDLKLGKAISLPNLPSRDESLKISSNGLRADFPGITRIENEKDRGKMLHFLANHELLAAELMALALLKFPNAPKEYRLGLYDAMREEQLHARLYIKRMKECNVALGEFPLNDFFWRITAPVETELDFITRMNLTFEQANLDYSKYYAEHFKIIGDESTATVLEKIYHDEMRHVGHGLKWFRYWKKSGQSDWDAYTEAIHFPLSATRAKGVVPFNEEARKEIGFDSEFISRLKVSQQSRGRTPIVHWFNPNAEVHVRTHATGKKLLMNRFEIAIEHDLEILMASMSRRDDIVLFRTPPSLSHLERLQRAGLELPDVISVNELGKRKLGGLRPWAWSPDASEFLKPFSSMVSDKVKEKWRPSLTNSLLSKKIGYQLEENLELIDSSRGVCKDLRTAFSYLRGGLIAYKPGYGCAGKGLRIADQRTDNLEAWLGAVIRDNGFVIAEPWVKRVQDLSVHYQKDEKNISLVGITKLINDHRGRFRGIKVAPKWSKLLSSEIAEFLFKEASFSEWYYEIIPNELEKLLGNYQGPVSIDSFVWRDGKGNLRLRHVVEVNVRMTMGRVALELQKKMAPNQWATFKIEKKDKYINKNNDLILNDPSKSREFLAVWETNRSEPN